jgi:hypothetical protein
MTEWVAWVEALENEADVDGPRARFYVTHGIPFLQLTPFRSAAARYGSEGVALQIAALAADGGSPDLLRGAEELPARRPVIPAQPTAKSADRLPDPDPA